jgi:hypothetical protein
MLGSSILLTLAGWQSSESVAVRSLTMTCLTYRHLMNRQARTGLLKTRQ